jgi:CBS domain-containing protein
LEETVNSARSVADIMMRDVAVLHEEDNVEHILQQMHQLKLRHVPVVDGRRLVGLISHHDILRFTVSQLLLDVPVPRTREEYLEQLEENTFVASVMTHDPITVTPQTAVAEAAELMFRANIGCLPVVEKDQLVGIVNETDFLGLLVRLLTARTDVSAA